jgi:hypothetical protein
LNAILRKISVPDLESRKQRLLSVENKVPGQKTGGFNRLFVLTQVRRNFLRFIPLKRK